MAACELLFQLPVGTMLVHILSEAQWSGVLQAGIELYSSSPDRQQLEGQHDHHQQQQQGQGEDVAMLDVGDELELPATQKGGKGAQASTKGLKMGKGRSSMTALPAAAVQAAVGREAKVSISARASQLFVGVLKEVIQLKVEASAGGGGGPAVQPQNGWHGQQHQQQQHSGYLSKELAPCQRVLLRLLQEESLAGRLQGMLADIGQSKP